MAYDDRPLIESRSPSNAPGDSLGGLISSPDLNSKGKPRAHAIRDVSQAREVTQTLISANSRRATVNSRLMAKLNAERPTSQSQLEKEGLGWRQNFTTRPLPLILEKVAPRFSAAVEAQKYLTNATLSDKWAAATQKSEFFRKTITETIRGRAGWKSLLDDIAFTNAFFGYNIVGVLDESSWFPNSFSWDETFVNDGTKQLPQFAQAVVLKQTLLPHELFDLIEDRDAAEAAGWNIENAIDAINTASPAQIRDILVQGTNVEAWYENARRELNLGVSYMGGASVIAVYNLLVTEVTGKVSHYRLAGTELKEIFSRDDRFERPDDVFSFFSFEKGNNTLHGSKGLGRQLYELAGMMDRARNEVVDRAILSGKTLIQGDIKRLHTFKMSVVGSTCIIPNGWQVLTQKIDGNIEPFLRLDAYFQMLIDQLVGSISPPQMGGQGEAFRSPAAWNVLTSLQEEARDARISRFLEQFVALVGLMTRRICSKDVTDKDAKAAREKLLTMMTEEEIKELAEQPVAGTIADLTPLERQMIVAIAQEKRGNPFYDGRALEMQDMVARIGTEFANEVLLPVEDPSIEAEQTRFQLMEFTLLALGQPVPVSPRDNHLLHLTALLPATEQLAGQILQGGSETAGLEASIQHATEHVNMAQAAGIDKDEPIMQAAQELVKNAGAALAQLKEIDQQAQALQQQDAGGGELPPEQMPQVPV